MDTVRSFGCAAWLDWGKFSIYYTVPYIIKVKESQALQGGRHRIYVNAPTSQKRSFTGTHVADANGMAMNAARICCNVARRARLPSQVGAGHSRTVPAPLLLGRARPKVRDSLGAFSGARSGQMKILIRLLQYGRAQDLRWGAQRIAKDAAVAICFVRIICSAS